MTDCIRASGNLGVFTGAVTTATGPATADQILQIKHGDQITATYQDTFPSEPVVAIRPADLLAPVISDVSSTNRLGGERIRWTTDEDANSIVRFGTNNVRNLAATNQVFRTDHSITLTNLVPGQTYNFVVISYDYAGNASTNDNGGAGFTFVAKAPATVLLVNAYEHNTPDESPEIPITSYTAALDGTGVSYEVWNVSTEGDPKLEDLLPFRVVIWRLNDSFWETGSTLGTSQQSLLQNYVKRDGSLLIASMELLSRLGDVPFRRDVLQVGSFTVKPDPFSPCETCDEDHGMPVLEGAAGDSIGRGVEVALNYDDYPFFEFFDLGPDVSDTFTPTAAAVPIFLDQFTGRVTGIRWPSDTGENGRVVFLSFPLDGIPMEGAEPNNRVSILRNILGFLAPGINGLERISFDRPAYSIPDQMRVEVADSDIAGAGSASVTIYSDTETAGINVILKETPRKGVFQGHVAVIRSDVTPKPGEIRVSDEDELRAVYLDVSANTSVEATADIDAVKPVITGTTTIVDYESALIQWSTDELTDAVVQYGESEILNRTSYDFVRNFDHQIILDGLKTDQVYYFQVVSRDVAGNTITDDNNGQLYTFRTKKPKTLPFTENFDGPTTEFTIENADGSELPWELGTPANDLQTSAHSGTKAWGTNLRGESGVEYTETALVSPAFELTGGNRATLRFWHSYDFTMDSTYEAASVYVVTNWQTQPILIGQYDDLAVAWEEEEIDLSAYIGKVVQIVWFYQLLEFEDVSNVHVGWLFDDVSVTMQSDSIGSLRVQSNVSQASYTISGPSPATGQGLAYTNNAAVPGSYTVTFAPIPYYTTPPAKTVTLTAGGNILVEGKYEIIDANNNSIADSWEQQYFGQSPPADGSLDSDADGSSNYSEFVAGTSPSDPVSRLTFQPSVYHQDGRFTLTWPTIAGRSYRILGSQDAQTWIDYTPWLRATSTAMSQTIPALSSSTGLYFQIEVRP